MRKLTLPGLVLAAALLLSALFAGSAAAQGTNTVGNAVCGAGGGEACESPSPATGPYNGFSPKYHCNNVLYTGNPSDVGAHEGNAYYAVGDADGDTPNENAVLNPGDQNATEAQHDSDCDNDVVAGADNQEPANPDGLGAADTGYYDQSIILLRPVGYLNSGNGSDSVHSPSCKADGTPPANGRNPGCNGDNDGEDAGYVGLGGPAGSATGDTDAVDGGLKGDLPGPL